MNWKGNSIKIINRENFIILNVGEKEYKNRGKIDRIDKTNGRLRVIDYKTGKKLYRANLVVKEIDEIRKEKGSIIFNLFYMIGIYKDVNEEFIKAELFH